MITLLILNKLDNLSKGRCTMVEQLHDAGLRSDYVSIALADVRHLPHYAEAMVSAEPADDEAVDGRRSARQRRRAQPQGGRLHPPASEPGTVG